MEIDDGFIVSVSDYCDRWCERCSLKARCRLFITGPQKSPTSLDRIVGDINGEPCVPLRPPDESKLPPDLEPGFGPDPYVIANARQLRVKFDRARRSASPAVRLAMEAIQHFTMFVPLRMIRAFSGAARGEAAAQQSDANGSGKAALLGLDRMKAAWRTLVDAGQITAADAAPFISEIDRLTRNVERALPQARLFVRPGFDEPEEVAMLVSSARH